MKSINYIENCRVYANYDNGTFDFSIDCIKDCNVTVFITNPKNEKITFNSKETNFSISVDVIPWSTKTPHLYNIEVVLNNDSEYKDTFICKRGFRKISIEEEKILLNGERQYFRGILHWGYYPKEMTFTSDKEKIREEVTKLKKQGFNAVKFCLFIPDKYYFELCDELGILVWQELPLWLPYDTGYLQDRIEKQ